MVSPLDDIRGSQSVPKVPVHCQSLVKEKPKAKANANHLN